MTSDCLLWEAVRKGKLCRPLIPDYFHQGPLIYAGVAVGLTHISDIYGSLLF